MLKNSKIKIVLVNVFLFVSLAGPSYATSYQDLFQGDLIADVAQKVLPSVVNISSVKTVVVEQSPFLSDPFFREFFGFVPQKRLEKALGSGVIVSGDGYIITNHHVIGGADKVEVRLADGKVFEASIVGSDPKSDVAVIKIAAKDLPAIAIGNSSNLRIGTLVLAVGNPFGLNQTVTMGIISALGRSGLGITDYENFIQTDAAINPGNSGGALVNMKGELIGINTAILSRSGGNVGIGFAIPVNLAMNIMKSIINYGKVVRGWLGVTVQDITSKIAKAMHLTSTRGVLVSGVVKDSPGDRGGIKRGDVIVEINSKPVTRSSELRFIVAEMQPGASARFKVLRNGKAKTLNIIIGDLSRAKIVSNKFVVKDNKFLAGAVIGDITGVARERLNLSQDLEGVIVFKVEAYSPAASTGLRPGDVIMGINGRDIHSLEELEKVLSDISGHKISLKIFRHGTIMKMTIIR
ncbi:MAG: DegQ family serine endoprotease [Deltaproteobacteria bacterium]|nr:DegQ family serine endoprotease [Deltaproteobacteria bacterium]